MNGGRACKHDMNGLKLLSLDFDGTLIGPWNGTQPEIASGLIASLECLRRQGVLIALNTGRTVPLVDQALRIFPFVPDYALTAEREVYRWEGRHWADVGGWNTRCHRAHDDLFREAAPLLEEIRRFVERDTEARLYYEDGLLAGVVAKTGEEMDRIQQFIACRQACCPDFSSQRNSIYLRFCHRAYDKGSVLNELQRVLTIGPEETFAAGDNFNDLPMLKRSCARWLACPANSVAEVKGVVSSGDGYVAEGAHGYGIVEALAYFFPEAFDERA
jgi:hydroxymethylpyrimidine pyrophosphatase-like HAD family hydrolase